MKAECLNIYSHYQSCSKSMTQAFTSDSELNSLTFLKWISFLAEIHADHLPTRAHYISCVRKAPLVLQP